MEKEGVESNSWETSWIMLGSMEKGGSFKQQLRDVTATDHLQQFAVVHLRLVTS